jgi:hypothetical protein
VKWARQGINVERDRAVFLCPRAASYVAGQILAVDGGMTDVELQRQGLGAGRVQLRRRLIEPAPAPGR